VEVCQIAGLVATGVRTAANHIQSTPALPDSTLVARSKSGDDDAFCEIVRRYQGFVYRQAWGYLHDDEAARDAAQEVFLTAYRGITYLRKNAVLRPWLYRVTRNHCLNVIRRRSLESRVQSNIKDDIKPDAALSVGLRRAISGLDDKYREVIILRYYNDLTYQEIGQVLSISVDNVKVRLFRARRKLKAMLGGTADEV
jgi:RNA polymerase sigma-70 factor (ECF subfamily)